MGQRPGRPASLTYAVDEWPPPAQLGLLALQYAVMIAVFIVLVVTILRHANVSDEARVHVLSMALVAAAVGTLLQGLPRGPIGSGFLAPPVYSATYLAPSILAAQIGGLPLVFGMTIFAGCVEIAVGLALNRLRLIFTPVISGLAVLFIGLQLGIVAIGEVLDVRGAAQGGLLLHLVVSVLTLGMCVALSIWGRGAARLLCLLAGLAAGMAAAALAGIIEPSGLAAVRSAETLALPWPDALSYRFDPTLAPAFLAAGLAAAVRTIGVVTSCQRLNDSDWRRPDLGNIRKGVLADGLATATAGVLGAPGMNISPSLVGLSSATGATSRVIAFVAALILLAIAFSPKAAAAFLTIPPQVAGAIFVFTSSFMIASGMQTILSRPMQTRTVYVVGISTMLALSKDVYPAYFRELSPVLASFTSSPLAIGLSAAIVLRLLFLAGTRQTAETVWSAAEDSIARAADFLRGKAHDWKVDTAIADLAVANAKEAMTRIRDADAKLDQGQLRVVHNGVDLRLDIVYPGTRSVEPPSTHRLVQFQHEDLHEEEAAAHLGLRDIAQGIAADRTRIRQMSDGKSVMQLWYAL